MENVVFQMIDNYVTKYEFNIDKRILPKEELRISGELNYMQFEPKTEKEGIKVGINLKIKMDLMTQDENNEKVGDINFIMEGIFLFDKAIKKEEMEKLLAINGAAMLYQQMRAYIQVNTSLSGITNIILPVVNFVNAVEKK